MIAVHDLAKQYHVGDHVVHALRGVTMSVAPAEFVTIVGPSGSGKSTFMHILGCLDRPTSGPLRAGRPRRVDAAGRRARARAQRDDRVRVPGLQPAGADLGASRTSSCRCSTRARAWSRRPSAAIARWRRSRRSASTDRAEHHPNQLSGGQQQRVAIARALVTRAVAAAGRRADRQSRHRDQPRSDGDLRAASARSAASRSS